MTDTLNDATFRRLVAVVLDNHDAPAEQLTPEATYLDLGVDSLTLVELSLRIERALGVEMGLDELTEDLTLAQTAHLIDTKLAARAA
ncbi:acyl carrier protein [Streptomyces sp. BBFR2]|uniref:acyl carrier protein n=1 Tax=Streptomyces sp. BBFR2 TaxID=3372854 RepID=UPI0037D9A531